MEPIAEQPGPETPREVFFNVDWGHEWPLWEPGSDHYNAEPSDYGLSRTLTAKLRDWYDRWESHFDSEGGWDSAADRDALQSAAVDLVADVQLELGAGYVVLNGFRTSFR